MSPKVPNPLKNQTINAINQPLNQLILGDCLEVLKTLPSESVDLCYIDPPFFSNRNYEVIWGDAGEIRSFTDRWAGGISHYIDWLKDRVREIHRVLKPTGSLYLHCDWHANSEIEVYILKPLFGENNFRNEIVWCYTGASGAVKNFPRKHDNIFWYSRRETYIFNSESLRIPYKKSNASAGKSSFSVLKGEERIKKLLELDERGKLMEDYWDLSIVNSMAKERIGYPTQKPEALLERIIKASSNPGDVVLDCFVGGGTTIAVADRLKRKWIGIDQSVQAVKVSEQRLINQQGLFEEPFTVKLHKYDFDTIRQMDPFKFEHLIAEKLGGLGNIKQRGDGGFDGSLADGTPLQVKRSDMIGINVIKNFFASLLTGDKQGYEKRLGAELAVGKVVAFSFGRGSREEAAKIKQDYGAMIELVEVGEIIPLAKKPKLRLEVVDMGIDKKSGKLGRKVSLQAVVDEPIEFFAWDFDYKTATGFKSEILRNLDGKIEIVLPVGINIVACKAVDTQGIEAIESIKIKVNGVVEVGENK